MEKMQSRTWGLTLLSTSKIVRAKLKIKGQINELEQLVVPIRDPETFLLATAQAAKSTGG
jgi:hypothetical protein